MCLGGLLQKWGAGGRYIGCGIMDWSGVDLGFERVDDCCLKAYL